jgi:serine/threonine protein kinase
MSIIGKGGMGGVYQAKDQKLGRDAAIKVLPEEFTKDADRVARFQREAELLASLNHPNIAAIYGLEESGGTNFPCPRTDRRPHAWLIACDPGALSLLTNVRLAQ